MTQQIQNAKGEAPFGLDEAGHGGDNVMVNVALLGISPESVMVAKSSHLAIDVI
jgi:hypothetical protein